MNETDFQRRLNHHLTLNYECDIDKIHGDVYQSGLPDLIGVTKNFKIGKGRAIYIECKVLTIPSKFESFIKINITPLQLHTLRQKKEKGALCLIACYIQFNDKKICLFMPPNIELKDKNYQITKKELFEYIIKCINSKNIGIGNNKIIYL